MKKIIIKHVFVTYSTHPDIKIERLTFQWSIFIKLAFAVLLEEIALERWGRVIFMSNVGITPSLLGRELLRLFCANTASSTVYELYSSAVTHDHVPLKSGLKNAEDKNVGDLLQSSHWCSTRLTCRSLNKTVQIHFLSKVVERLELNIFLKYEILCPNFELRYLEFKFVLGV